MLDIIEAQFPNLAHDMQRAFRKRAYSKRTHLWRIPQDSEFFKDSFDTHSLAQRDAKSKGDERRASFESKVKTKECRYAVPVDSLRKAIGQKLALEQYRKSKVDGSTENKEMYAWLSKDILELRELLLQTDAPRATELGISEQWGIAVTDAYAEICHLLTDFLSKSSRICSIWLHGAAAVNTLPSGAGLKAHMPHESSRSSCSATA